MQIFIFIMYFLQLPAYNNIDHSNSKIYFEKRFNFRAPFRSLQLKGESLILIKLIQETKTAEVKN